MQHSPKTNACGKVLHIKVIPTSEASLQNQVIDLLIDKVNGITSFVVSIGIMFRQTSNSVTTLRIVSNTRPEWDED